jgi:hypothetical protein
MACDLDTVRDSKDPGGPRLAFTPGQWTAFAIAVRETPAARPKSR